MIGEALVRVRRGAGVESEHRVAWATTDRGRGGRAHAAGGGSAAYPGPTVYARSAAKPFQALAGVRAGVPERFGLSTEHLAMACASHGGSDAHVERVREILAAAGRSEDDLACGASEPRDPAAAIAFRGAGEQPASIRHNCSGKHAFGLAFAAAEGWPTEGYIDKGHPLQDAMEGGMAEATRVGAGELDARHRRLRHAHVLGADRAAGGGVRPARRRAVSGRRASGCAAAMSAHPQLVAYDGAIDTELMRAHPRLVSKIGAEGVLGIGLPDGRGAALKVLDGATRALDVVAPLLLEEHWDIEVGGDRARRAARGAGAQLARGARRRRRGDARRVIDAAAIARDTAALGPGAQPDRRRARRRSSGSASWPPRSGSTPSCTSTTSPRCARTPTIPARRRRATSCSGSAVDAARHAAGPASRSTATSTSSAPGTEPWRYEPFVGRDRGRPRARPRLGRHEGRRRRRAARAGRAARAASAPEVVLQAVASEEDGGLGTFAALERDAAFDAVPDPRADRLRGRLRAGRRADVPRHRARPRRPRRDAARRPLRARPLRRPRTSRSRRHERALNRDVEHPRDAGARAALSDQRRA